jgi:uncharacterized protein YxjI
MLFTKNTYLIKERFELLKVVDRYDIFDPETGAIVAYAKENIPEWKKMLRWFVNKSWMSTTIEIKDVVTEQIAFTVERPFTWLRSRVEVKDGEGIPIGYFQSRLLSIGGAFDVYNADNVKIADVKGNWTGWNFTFTDINGREIGRVTKKWAGIGKEFFTNSDNYIVSISERFPNAPMQMALLIIAGLAVDVVYKEKE